MILTFSYDMMIEFLFRNRIEEYYRQEMIGLPYIERMEHWKYRNVHLCTCLEMKGQKTVQVCRDCLLSLKRF